MKKDNNSNNPQDWTTKKLKDEYISYYDTVYGQHSCYGSRDIRILDSLEEELSNRGISINLTPNFN